MLTHSTIKKSMHPKLYLLDTYKFQFLHAFHSSTGGGALVRGVCTKSQRRVVPGTAAEAIRPELHHLQAGTFMSVAH